MGLLRGAGGDGGDVLAGEEEAVADLGDGEHGDDAGGDAGGLEVEGVEHGAGVRAAQDGGVDQAGGALVVGVAGGAGDLGGGLDARVGLADDVELAGGVPRLGLAGREGDLDVAELIGEADFNFLGAVGHHAAPLLFATDRTAATMLG